MNKLAEQLRLIGVFNTHDLLVRFADKGKDIAVYYRPCPAGRMGMADYDKTYVFSPSHQTDKNSHFSHYGKKSFDGKRAKSLAPALAWASERYGIPEWATDPTNRNCKIPAEVLKRARAAVKDAPEPQTETERDEVKA